MARPLQQLGVERYAIYPKPFWRWYDEYEDECLRPEHDGNREFDKSDECAYYFHGGDWCFINAATGVKVEASHEFALGFHGDFGLLEFAFFIAYSSTSAVSRP
jgi:hypothetical protein